MFNFPVFINLENKDVVVIGGGSVANRKVKKLLSASAKVTVVAPELHSELEPLYTNGKIHWLKESCKPKHLTSAFMVISASGNKEAQHIINSTVAPHQLVNGADNPSIGNIAFPASFEEEDYHIAISTKGKNPSAAKKLKQQLQKWFHPREQ
ncbi:precorrin-2 dehydrogenase/sirohydrochlorin ferrochelatase family protein [Alteribacillus bidgolensis]|uniref:precorrin-2 dehydrogenase/sirohydrochlorin ferrochelatase family protein n=1 Tax=Alteribacillus bidgolensis TaxID=930129 RepID=UPI00147522C4|nr:bifunctional precorrin-2 dehydrogenase/sirohydrochlorin ferrochelatase [Alteribacillus bidgolensis]